MDGYPRDARFAPDRKTRTIRIVVAAICVPFAVLGFGALAVAIRLSLRSPQAVPLATIVGSGVLAVLLIALVIVRMRSIVATAVRSRPGATVFLSCFSPDLGRALSDLQLSMPQYRYFGVAITPTALELWPPGRFPQPIAFPWSTIDEVVPGRTMAPTRYGWTTAPALHLQVVHGSEPVDLPLAMYGPLGMSVAGVRRRNELFLEVSRHVRPR